MFLISVPISSVSPGFGPFSSQRPSSSPIEPREVYIEPRLGIDEGGCVRISSTVSLLKDISLKLWAGLFPNAWWDEPSPGFRSPRLG